MTDKDLRRAYSAMKVTSLHRRMKAKAVEYKGGKCHECGYFKSLAALTFHHRKPEEKDFSISGRVVKWEKLRPELDKCDLLCSNCHHEEHEKIAEKKWQELNLTVRKSIPERKSPTIETVQCPTCRKSFQKLSSSTKRFCSHKCSCESRNSTTWPTEADLRDMVWEEPVTSIAKKLGVSGAAVKKRCVKLGINTPGFGYWSKSLEDRPMARTTASDAVYLGSTPSLPTIESQGSS